MKRHEPRVLGREFSSLIFAGTLAFVSANLEPADCNLNGEDAAREIASGAALDCNGNGLPDTCDLEAQGFRLSPGARIEICKLAFGYRLADLDGNGQQDLLGIAASEPRWFGAYLRNQDGTFHAEPERLWTFSVGGGGLEAADLDGDEHIEVILFQPPSSILILGNDGAGRLSPAGGFSLEGGEAPYSSFVTDLDADGDLDMATSAFRLHIHVNEGGMVFHAEQAIAGIKGPGNLAGADLDHDGDTDLILSYELRDGISILRNDGNGALSAPEHHTSGGTDAQISGGIRVFTADIDGDGWQDVVSSNAPRHDGSLFYNDGRGGLLPPIHFPAMGSAGDLTLADLDGNGAQDLIAVDSTEGVLRALLDSNGTFSEPYTMALDSPFALLLASDLDRDGRTDVAIVSLGGAHGPAVQLFTNEARSRSLDCDANGVPDECDISAGDAGDCNSNGVPDACEIRSGDASDCDANGIPDGCDVAPPAVRLTGPDVLTADSFDERITAVDLDGDGDADLAVTNSLHEYVSVLRNKGDGSFLSQVRIGVRGQPAGVLGADLDGDGDIDLMVPESKFIDVLLNAGNGAFAPAKSFVAGNSPLSAAIADVDADQKQDIIAANRDSNDLSVLLNAGEGMFAEAVRVPTATRPSAIVTGDLDGDGDLDLAVASGDTQALAIHLGTGEGIGEAMSLEVPGIPTALATGDVDDDGDVDIAVALGSNLLLLLAEGVTIAAEQEYLEEISAKQQVILSDIDGDRDVDIITSFGSVSVGRRESGEYVREDPYLGGEVAAADLDQDGLVDLIGVSSRFLSVRLQLEGGGFVPHGEGLAGDQAGDAATADLDGDADLDLVVVTDGLALLENDGTGRLHAGPKLQTDPIPIAAACGDLDGDGDQDIAVVHSISTRVAVFHNMGSGAFPLLPDARVEIGSDHTALALVDVEGDGDRDLLVCARAPGRSGRTLAVSRNDGAGTFEAPEFHPAGDLGAFIAAGDVDGDGFVDAVVGGGDELVLLGNNGDGTFRGPIEIGSVSGVQHLVMGDIDADGNEDIAAASGMQLFLRFGDGAGTFPGRRSIPIGSRFERISVALLDLTLDGLLDVAISRPSDRDIRLLVNLGTREFLEVPAPSISGTPAHVLGADMDGNQRHDLVLIKTSPGTALTLLNETFAGGRPDCNANGILDVCELEGWDCDRNGVLDSCELSPGFALEDPVPVVEGLSNGGVAAGDWDSDGWTDLAITMAGSPGTGQVLVLRNDGLGGFGGTPYPVPAQSGRLRPTDLDRDGDLDVIVGETAVLLLNDGGGSLDPVASPFFAPTHWSAADWNDDGRPDVALAFGTVRILFQTDLLEFVQGPTFFGVPVPRGVTAADLDGDSRLDLLAISWEASILLVALQDAKGTFLDPTRIPLAGQPLAMAAADLDADDDVDVTLALDGVTILWNDGGGMFPTARSLPASALGSTGSGSPIEDILIEDVDGDSWPDIIGAAWGAAYLFRNVGGAFAPARRYLGVTPNMAALDIDNDGALDLAVAGVRDPTAAHPVALHLITGVRTPPSGRDENSNGTVDGCESFSFRRGDANADGALDIVDPIFSFLYLFSEGEAPPCLEAADATDDGRINISDPIRVLNYLFLGTAAPPSPGPPPAPCGPDPEGDDSLLGCGSYGAC